MTGKKALRLADCGVRQKQSLLGLGAHHEMLADHGTSPDQARRVLWWDAGSAEKLCLGWSQSCCHWCYGWQQSLPYRLLGAGARRSDGGSSELGAQMVGTGPSQHCFAPRESRSVALVEFHAGTPHQACTLLAKFSTRPSKADALQSLLFFQQVCCAAR